MLIKVQKTDDGIEHLHGVLKEKKHTITRVHFWKIPHKSQVEDICLKLGRYDKLGFDPDTLESTSPRSELTLDNEEFRSLISFLQENYEPFEKGVRQYVPITEGFDESQIPYLRALFANPDKGDLLSMIVENNIIPQDLVRGLEHSQRLKAVEEFETMLAEDLVESDWQSWFEENDWVLGSEFVRVLDDRRIDVENIGDYLMQAYDGFLDVIEIKRPEGGLRFWADKKDHDNYYPSSDLTKAITQATRYVYEVEREANSLKFLERVEGVKAIKPRCTLIFGRSVNWDREQREAYRILNASFHNLTILTYDHVLDRAKRMVGLI